VGTASSISTKKCRKTKETIYYPDVANPCTFPLIAHMGDIKMDSLAFFNGFLELFQRFFFTCSPLCSKEKQWWSTYVISTITNKMYSWLYTVTYLHMF
jgi:hypothetical protein